MIASNSSPPAVPVTAPKKKREHDLENPREKFLVHPVENAPSDMVAEDAKKQHRPEKRKVRPEGEAEKAEHDQLEDVGRRHESRQRCSVVAAVRANS